MLIRTSGCGPESGAPDTHLQMPPIPFNGIWIAVSQDTTELSFKTDVVQIRAIEVGQPFSAWTWRNSKSGPCAPTFNVVEYAWTVLSVDGNRFRARKDFAREVYRINSTGECHTKGGSPFEGEWAYDPPSDTLRLGGKILVRSPAPL